MKNQPFTVRIIGIKNSGKTTLVVGVVEKLSRQNLKIGTIKHSSHDHDFDHEGTDSWAHQKAGSSSTLNISPEKLVLHSRNDDSRLGALMELAFDECDILIVEGHSGHADRTIEVVDPSKEPHFSSLEKVDLIVGGDAELLSSMPHFNRDDLYAISKWIVVESER